MHPDIIRTEHRQTPGGWETTNYWNCGCVDDFVVAVTYQHDWAESQVTDGMLSRRCPEFPVCVWRRWPALAGDAGSAGEQMERVNPIDPAE